jgi:cytochrome c peroxidase
MQRNACTGTGALGGGTTMKKKQLALSMVVVAIAVLAVAAEPEKAVDATGQTIVLQAGHPSLAKWLLPAEVPSPPDNRLTPERAELGKELFFDPRLSSMGMSSYASCHFSERGWSDGFPKSIRLFGEVMTRASPTIVNVGYNPIHMWAAAARRSSTRRKTASAPPDR